MLMSALLLALSAQSASGIPRDDALRDVHDPDVIVIQGRRATSDLAACLARRCPPEEEMEAVVQASVLQFGAGDYTRAARTLRGGIARNERYAERFPMPVATMHATLASVLQHDGDLDGMRIAARSSVGILERNLGTAHPVVLRQRLFLAETMLRRRQLASAAGELRKVSEGAEAGGDLVLAASAQMRLAWLSLAQRKHEASREHAANAQRMAAADPGIATDLQVLRARLGMPNWTPERAQSISSGMPPVQRSDPYLVYSPPFLPYNGGSSGFEGLKGANLDTGVRFADIGFFITNAGVVENVTYLRGRGTEAMSEGLVRQVKGRRYAAFVPPSGTDGVYRVERVTLRGDLGRVTSSRIPQRLGDLGLNVEVADITATRDLAERLLTLSRTRDEVSSKPNPEAQ